MCLIGQSTSTFEHETEPSSSENDTMLDESSSENENLPNGPDSDSDEKDVPELVHDMDGMTLVECVRYWALRTNQDHSSINMIMRIIAKKTDGILPRDARTLLRTPRKKTEIGSIAGGQYWYRGIKTCLADYFRYCIITCFSDIDF